VEELRLVLEGAPISDFLPEQKHHGRAQFNEKQDASC